MENYLVTLKFSRTLDEYKSDRMPTAAALTQLQAIGKSLRPGQRMRFIYTYGQAGRACLGSAHAGCAGSSISRATGLLFLRAAATLLQPMGLADDEFQAAEWLRGDPVAQELPFTTLPVLGDLAAMSRMG